MVEIHGKPFLEYLVEMLREQGFERVLLLLGYLPEVVQEYFGDGRRWGLTIDYSVTPVEDESGRRVKAVEGRLDPRFLLMYCDNYWPMRFQHMWERFTAASVPAMVTVYSNKDGYTKDSVLVDSHGYVVVYDKGRTHPDLRGVEISYAILEKEAVVALLTWANVPFEVAVYPRLAEQRRLLAYVTDHLYYSVGSAGRLPRTAAFLARQPAVILDRDGVLNRKPPRAEYVRTWDDFEWMPGAKDALRLLKRAGFKVVVVSNQAGVARGRMSEADVKDVHARMTREAEEAGGGIDGIYYCPHHWDDGCDCRKPKPGMLFSAQRDFDLDLTRTLFIGDDERDGQAARAAGCRFALISEVVPLLDVVHDLIRDEVKN
jgi:D-glycero-D-manno-heptose 1,7-bisphosphate phosphatase